MAAVSGSIPNLIGGVSQQPPEIRALNSSTFLTNSWSDVATGLSTRPCARYLGANGAAPTGDETVAAHTIQKSTGRYHISVVDGAVRVFNLDTQLTESVSVTDDADDYLASDDPARDIGFVTIGDSTFIYNKSVTVTVTNDEDGTGATGNTEAGSLRHNPNRYSTAWMKQRAGYMANYNLYHNETLVATHATDANTPEQIMNGLKSDLTTAGFTVYHVAGTIAAVLLADEDDYFVATDDFGNQALFCYNDFVDEYTDLPNNDKIGRLVMIKQSREEDADDYWVWRKGGEWQETYGWNAHEQINNTTMPVTLFDNGDGTWELRKNTWGGRSVGDADSNPTPSFVNRTINSMFIYKGRMCILADENFCASQVNAYENFYRSTCIQLLDDDPIDIAAPESRGAAVRWAKEFDKALLISSKFDQFRVEGDSEGLLGPNTVNIRTVNNYNTSEYVEPCYVGPNIVFVDDFNDGRFAGLKEYQVERVFGREVALSITDAVPEYINSGVYRIISSSTDNILALLTKGERESLWLYNFYFNNEGKVQSSWQKWTLPGSIYSADFVEDRLTLTIAYDGQLHIVDVTFDAGADTILDDDSILLDFKHTHDDVVVTLDGNDTIVTMPFEVHTDDLENIALVISPENTGPHNKGRIYAPASKSGDDLRFTNVDLSGDQFSLGFRFQFRWIISPIFLRDGNLVAIHDARLQLRRISLLYNQSGPFNVHYTPKGRDTYTSAYTGFTLGDSQDVLGSLSLNSGKFKFAANGESSVGEIEVEAWTPWRVRFSSLEWDGIYRPKKRRTT